MVILTCLYSFLTQRRDTCVTDLAFLGCLSVGRGVVSERFELLLVTGSRKAVLYAFIDEMAHGKTLGGSRSPFFGEMMAARCPGCFSELD
jgi:hypothetical protein